MQKELNNRERERKKKLLSLCKICEKSGLTIHIAVTGHKPLFDNVEILEKENNFHKRSIKEMIHIKTNDNLKRKSDLLALNPAYDGLLNNIKRKKKDST